VRIGRGQVRRVHALVDPGAGAPAVARRFIPPVVPSDSVVPTHASWLNQVEIWFSILSRQLLKRGEFISKEDQARKIADYIESYNQKGATVRLDLAGPGLSGLDYLHELQD